MLTDDQVKTLKQFVSEFYEIGNHGLVIRGYFNSNGYSTLTDLIKTTQDPLSMKVQALIIGTDYAYYHLAGKLLEFLNRPSLLEIEEAMQEARRRRKIEREDQRNSGESPLNTPPINGNISAQPDDTGFQKEQR